MLFVTYVVFEMGASMKLFSLNYDNNNNGDFEVGISTRKGRERMRGKKAKPKWSRIFDLGYGMFETVFSSTLLTSWWKRISYGKSTTLLNAGGAINILCSLLQLRCKWFEKQ